MDQEYSGLFRQNSERLFVSEPVSTGERLAVPYRIHSNEEFHSRSESGKGQPTKLYLLTENSHG